MLISSVTGPERRTVLGHPKLIECIGICDLSLAHGSEIRGSDVFLHIVKKLYGIFSLNSAKYVPLDGLSLDFLGGFFNLFLRGVCGANHLLEIHGISGLKHFLSSGHMKSDLNRMRT